MQRVSAVLGSALFFVVAPCVLAGLIPWSMTRWEFGRAFFGLEITRAVGVLLILVGLPGLVDSFARFALQGLGTPAPVAPTKNLVVTGLYRYVRNPIYVAVVLNLPTGRVVRARPLQLSAAPGLSSSPDLGAAHRCSVINAAAPRGDGRGSFAHGQAAQ